jgi:hypothetical protein
MLLVKRYRARGQDSRDDRGLRHDILASFVRMNDFIGKYSGLGFSGAE